MTRDFRDAEVSSLGRVRELDVLLEALDVGMPDDAVVYVENSGLTPEVSAALAALPQVPESERRSDLQGSVGCPTAFHILVRAGVIRVLRNLAARHAEPEVCAHVAVYRGEEILALAHDAAGGRLLVGVTLPAENVDRMRAVVARDPGRR